MNKIEYLIAMLYANNNEPIKGITRLEKLIFYYLKRIQDNDNLKAFDFEAYNFGPHSDDIRDLLYALRDKGIISIESHVSENSLEIDDIEQDQEELLPIGYDKLEIYKLSEKGELVGQKVFEKIENQEFLHKFKDKFNKMNLKKFIQIVYVEYPEMTVRSKIKDILFS